MLLVAPPPVRVEEEYFLDQEVSESRMPATVSGSGGTVRAALACDGDAYRAWYAHDEAAATGAVGHLAFTGHDATDLGASCRRGRLPLTVPGIGRVAAVEGSKEVAWAFDYRPTASSGPVPTLLEVAQVDVRIDDQDTADLDRTLLGEHWSQREIEEAKLDAVAQTMMDHARFRPHLVVTVEVTVGIELPRTRAVPRATVRSVSVEFPHPVSLDPSSLTLAVRERSSKGWRTRRPALHQDPENRSVRWHEIPIAAEAQGSGRAGGTTTTWILASPPMALTIGQPGELFEHDDLRITAVVDLEGTLLSGTRTKVFDTRGRPRSRSLVERSVLHLHCTVSLADAFAGRELSPYQSLVFDEIVPDRRRASDVQSVLRSLGFEVEAKPLTSPEHPLLWLMSATRGSGPTRSVLWVVVRGRRAATHRRTRQGEDQQFSSRLESGDLTLFVRGWARGSAAGLVSQINDLHVALKERFRPLRSRK